MADVIPRPPEEPTDDMCCHRGCDPCIFDYYERALERWESRVRALGHDPAALLAKSVAPPSGELSRRD